MRWGVEEAYKMLKNRVQLEMFSGRTPRSIHQDFHSKIMMMSLCATLSFPIEEKVRKEYSAAARGNKYDQTINRTDALSQTRKSLIDIFLKGIVRKKLKKFDEIVLKARQCIRPGRSEFRQKKKRGRPPINYKQL